MDDDGLEDRRVFLSPFGRPTPTVSKPDWFEAVARLIVDGPGVEDRIAGVVRAHVEDDGGTTFTYKVQRRGDLARCTSLDGSVHFIAGRETVWRRREDGTQWMAERPRSRGAYAPDDYEFGVTRDDAERWEGDDFTTPTGPARDTTFLGRAAWEIELAPPPHKPEPMQITVDRSTGLILRQANAAFGTFHEWIGLDSDPDLPDELFTLRPADRVAVRYG
ncbi:hypothetical protein [Jatrophihabitans sp.]|uniref:hypothetical protein n=1 Tax=Jatrophihabitans sp. TaxID=1932789 RepID=UPI0030C6AA55|nr:hypothetical protein [Jatrophihabitans sp.]